MRYGWSMRGSAFGLWPSLSKITGSESTQWSSTIHEDNYDRQFSIGCGANYTHVTRAPTIVYASENGRGNTGDGANIRYMGIMVLMNPRVFGGLAAGLEEPRKKSFAHLEATRIHPGWAPHMLYVSPGEDGKYRVTGHEGRHRSIVARNLSCALIPVAIIDYGKRASRITPKILGTMRAGMWSQEENIARSTWRRGPLFDVAFVDGKRYVWSDPTE